MIPSEELDRLLRLNVLLSKNSDEPLHSQLTRSLRRLVLRHFENGERFYTEENLSETLGLSVGTVRHSMNRLVEEGLLLRRRGKGSFVCRPKRSETRGMHVVTLVNTFDSFFNNMLLRELSYYCQRNGYSMEVLNPGQDKRVKSVIDTASISGAHTGFIFMCLEHDFVYDLVQLMNMRHIPSVNLDTWITGYPGNQVGVDNQQGIRLGLDHLKGLGHRRVAMLLSEWAGHENIQARLNAFQAGVEQCGLSGYVIESSPLPVFGDLGDELHLPTQARYNFCIDEQVTGKVLSSGATAVLCVSDIAACFLMKRLQMSGTRIPEEISVLGFNDEGTGELVYPALTTIAQPFDEIAQTSLNMLEKHDDFNRHIKLGPKLVVRNSTGPCPY